MRTIKFRAWDKETKEIVYPHKLNFNRGWAYYEDNKQEIQRVDILKGRNLMQYTGLKDKNKQDIYEGDIAEYTDYYKITRIGKIKFVGGCFKIETISDGEGSPKDSIIHDILSNFTTPIKSHLDNDGVIKCDTQYPYVEVEVIGNIYENLELIKKEEEKGEEDEM